MTKKKEGFILCIGEDVDSEMLSRVCDAPIFCTSDREKALSFLQRSDLMYVRTRNGTEFFHRSEILFVETNRRNVRIVTVRKVIEEAYTGLGAFIHQVGRPYFVRCHKSFAVNIMNVRKVSKISRRLWEASFDRPSDPPCLVSQKYYDNMMNHLHRSMVHSD